MKKIIVTFIAALILAAALIALSGCGDTVVLNVYNWGEYISTGKEGTYNTNREFEKWYLEKYGKKIRVNYDTFDSNEALREAGDRVGQLRRDRSVRLHDRVLHKERYACRA